MKRFDPKQQPLNKVSYEKAKIIDSRIVFAIALFCGQQRDEWINPNLAIWIATTYDTQRVRFIIYPIHGWHPKSAARNEAVRLALRDNADYLMMVDNNVAPHMDLMATIIELDERHDIWGPPVYRWNAAQGAAIPEFGNRKKLKDEEREEILKAAKDDSEREKMAEELKRFPYFEPVTEIEKEGLIEVTGHLSPQCFIIHQRVMKTMPAPLFRERIDPGTGRFLIPHEMDFFARAHDEKFRMFVDTRRMSGSYATMDMAELNFKTAMLLSQAAGKKPPTPAPIEEVQAIAQSAAVELGKNADLPFHCACCGTGMTSAGGVCGDCAAKGTGVAVG